MVMYWGQAAVWFGHFLPRLALPVVVPLIAHDLAATTQQRAMLLSSFFRGYLLTQILGGLVAQRVGGKLVLTFDLSGLVVSFASLPLAVRSGPRAVALCLGAMGMFMGPILSAASINKNNWLPKDGGDRAIAQMVMGTGTKLARISAVTVTPILCARFGWRGAVKLYSAVAGVIVVLWQVFAREKPTAAVAAALRGEQLQPQPQPEKEKGKEKKKTFEPRILRHPKVLSLFAMHTAYNNSDVRAAALFATEVCLATPDTAIQC